MSNASATWAPISKRAGVAVTPNMLDYAQTCASFRWDAAWKELLSSPRAAGVNIADLAVDRQAEGPLAAHVALRWLGKRGERRDITFADLRALTNRFANALRTLGIGKGERVFALTGRVPEHTIAALGTLKNTSVFCPLFSAFGPEPLAQRLERGDARVLVTSYRLYQKHVAALRLRLPQLQHYLITDIEDHVGDGVWSFAKLLQDASPEFAIPRTEPSDMALLHFTSGTTGMPKGAIHVHEAVVMHYITGKYVLDLHPDDVYWCTADPGWVTGTSYGMIAPLLHGVTNLSDEGEFDSERWYRTLAAEAVSVWYTAPTAVRMLMRSPIEPRTAYDLRRLRFVASVGEPLNPSAVLWGQQTLGLPIHDNWWQTETGGIMIANYPSMEIRPGSMGRPVPGIEAGIVRRAAGDTIEAVTEPDAEGELALRPGWPSMFRGYLHDDARYAKCFVDGWYLTGDLARRDADGYFTFVGRADDIIKTAGHMVGPFEVESVLMEHPAVAEAAVIGKPEATIGELVKAFVVLKPEHVGNEQLSLDILGFARTRLGSVVAPKELEFIAQIPRTRSGKLMRRLLKARELGLPTGDVSTLEGT
ncbi:MAG TPA: acetate--CoA ligase [Candidatus Dormibacteraeota bacterium]|nr:acetate--CoA ligase [Candidatus Dormibacteraeota bacterium]